MSFLAPFYLLGALAISLPALFHLIRRTPRGRQPFSPLLFLTPSPPRITRRSRIEHWLLLLLRAAVLGLLALAFSRPFLRETASLLLDSGVGQRIAVVVDTSASMRRGDLWPQLLTRADKLLGALGPADEIGLFSFDESVRMVVDWQEPLPNLAARQARLRSALQTLSPTWGRTRLGEALATVADRLVAEAGEKRDERPTTIYLLTDLQHGADTAALQAYEWPKEVLLQVERLQPASPGNAAVRVLESDDQPGRRVRVVNAAGAQAEQFEVRWTGTGAAATAGETVSVYVPAGQSRVVRLPAPPAGADRVLLTGDLQPFDNEFYFAPVHRRELRVAYLGREAANDPQGLRYYLERVWTDTPRRKVRWETQPPSLPAGQPDDSPPRQPAPLVVIASAPDEAQAARLQDFVRGGGTVLFVAGDSEAAAALARFAAGVRHLPGEVAKPAGGTFALLSDIDFSHPVFAAFAGPRYNDFTKIHIWNHQRFALDTAAQAHVLARFDNGDPAVWQQTIGEGRLLCLACSWRPADSQLALSSKFVPLLSRLLDHLTGIDEDGVQGSRVHQPLALPVLPGSGETLITKPDGELVRLAAASDLFREADQPGIYRALRSGEQVEFAVNLDPAESDTTPLDTAQLEQLGVRAGRQPSHAEQLERQRQMRDTELESRQKLWRWLLAGVLGLVAVETIVAGRIARRSERREEPS